MEVRLYDHNIDAERLNLFNIQVFGSPSIKSNTSNETVREKNPYGETPGPTAIAISNNKIVGHLTSTPFALWMNNEEKIAYWLSGFHVLPETRGSGVGTRLVACLTEALPILSAVVVVEPSLRAFQANSWQYPGKIREYIHIVNPKALDSILTIDRVDRFLPSALKSFAQPLLKVARAPTRFAIRVFKRWKAVHGKIQAGRQLPFRECEYFDQSCEDLWHKAKNKLALTHVRNTDYLNWLFPHHRGWKKRVCTENGLATAWLLYTIKHYSDNGPLHGLTALNIIDALWDTSSPAATGALVDHMLALGYDNKADLILASGHQTHLNLALRNAAFLPLPSTVYVGFYRKDMGTSFSDVFSSAYITRGYADAAGGLAP